MNILHIQDLRKRALEVIEETTEENCIITFVEVKLKREQLSIIAKPFFGWDESFLYEYYKNKINGHLCLSKSRYTTREDQPNIQYLIDLGVKAMSMGIKVDE